MKGLPGFGSCARCPYQGTGPPVPCWDCASPQLAWEPSPRCEVCDHPLAAGRACGNYWCHREDRAFDLVWAMAAHRAVLRSVIARCKYRGAREWAVVLGRLVAGYLDRHAPWFEEFEVVTACPGRPTPERPWDHMAAILSAAAEASSVWPWDLGCVVKTSPTAALMRRGSGEARRLWAACDLRPALAVPAPELVHDRQILVVDDVFTDGSTLREVARVLRAAGATGVSGLIIARQTWRSLV